MNNLLAFDYETAIKDISRVITCDGRKVTDLHHFVTSEVRYPLYGVVDGAVHRFTMNGKWNESVVGESTIYDLFLLPEKKVVYQNVYPISTADARPYYHSTEELAKISCPDEHDRRAVAIARLTFCGDMLDDIQIVHRYNQ